MSTHSSAPSNKLKMLFENSAVAISWRQGKWVILGRSERQHRDLPKSLSSIVAEMVKAGQLAMAEDGCLRPVGAAVQTLQRADESPLSKLVNMRETSGQSYFDDAQIRAGEKLRHHYERAHMAPRMTANYSPSDGGGDRHWTSSDNAIARLSDDTLLARQAVHQALEAVGPELSSILLKICCMDCGMEEAERLLDIPRRAGKAILALGLTRLARHYHLKPRQRHAGPEKIGHWAVDDFRPTIAPRSTV